MNPERGWYHADGDPEGTVRLWNGHEWVGFPQRDPRIELGDGGIEPFTPIRGQVRLKWLGLANRILFAAMAFGFLVLGLVTLSGAVLTNDSAADLVAPSATDVGVESAPADETSAEFGLLLLVVVLLALSPALAFLPWFYIAYKNLTRWHHAQYEPAWTIVAWFVPIMNLRRPWRMMSELMERSPDRQHAGAINPVLGMAWWLLWILPGLAFNLVLVSLVKSDPIAVAQDPSIAAKWVLVVNGITYLLEALSLVCLVMIISQVTKYQDLRLQPSAAQLKMAQVRTENLAKIALPAEVEPRSFG